MRQGPPLVKGLTLAGKGVVVLSGRRLRKWSLANGRLLAEAKACFSFRGALLSLGPARLAVVCESEMLFYDAQDLRYLGKKELGGLARAAAVHRGCVAAAFADKRMVVYRGRDLHSVFDWKLKQGIRAVAVSADCAKVALALEDGRVLLAGKDHKLKVVLERPGLAPSQLRFGPDARRLLVATAPTVLLVDLETTSKVRAFPATQAVASLAWLGPDAAALAAPDGLLELQVLTGTSRSLAARGRGLLLAATAGDLCAAWADGWLGCFGRGPLPQAGARSLALPVYQASSAVYGRVAAIQGRQLRLRIYQGEVLPKSKQRFRVMRYSEQRTGDRVDVRWLPIGEGQVVGVTGSAVLLRLERTVDPLIQRARRLPYDTPVRLLPGLPAH
jgi:hypothetical protein